MFKMKPGNDLVLPVFKRFIDLQLASGITDITKETVIDHARVKVVAFNKKYASVESTLLSTPITPKEKIEYQAALAYNDYIDKLVNRAFISKGSILGSGIRIWSSLRIGGDRIYTHVPSCTTQEFTQLRYQDSTFALKKAKKIAYYDKLEAKYYKKEQHKYLVNSRGWKTNRDSRLRVDRRRKTAVRAMLQLLNVAS